MANLFGITHSEQFLYITNKNCEPMANLFGIAHSEQFLYIAQEPDILH